jgi:WD40 repeat protein
MAIHGCGLIHRDLKPSNVILADDGPRIIDFGIARGADATALTGSSVVIGTLRYMSPEQLQGQELTPHSDVFALGTVLTFAATGHDPFQGPTIPSVITRILTGPPDLDPLTGELRGIIGECLAKEPGRRPSPGDLLERFSRLPPHDPTVTATPTPVPASGGPVLSTAREPSLADTLNVSPVLPQGRTDPSAARADRPRALVKPGHPVQQPAGRLARPGSRRHAGLIAVGIAATVVLAAVGTGAGLWLSASPPSPSATPPRPSTSPATSSPSTLSPATSAPPVHSSAPSAAGSLTVNTCARDTATSGSSPTKIGSITTGSPVNDFVDVAFSPDCQIVAAGGNGVVQIRNMVTGSRVATLSAAPGSDVCIDAFTPNGKDLAVAGADGNTTLWNAATGHLEARFPSDPSGGTWLLAVSPDSSQVYTGGSTGVVGVWGVATHQSTGTINTGTAVGAMALSPDGKLLAVGGYDGVIRVYDTASRTQDMALPGNEGHIWSMAFSPDGSTLAAGSNVVQWWGVATGKLIVQRASPGGSVTDVAFNPAGTVLAAGGYEMAGLWNVGTHQLITTVNLGTTAAGASANASYPNGIAFSRYGAILAVGWYGTLEFWNVAGVTSSNH